MPENDKAPNVSGQATLLLVDDEENILAALKRLLRRDGYLILAATSGAEGLQLLEQYPVDVIVSDQRMPHMTGVEFLRKAKDSYPDTVRIVLSGYTELQSIIDAVNEGAVYKFLTKPWDDELLRGHIREAVRQKQMADDNTRLAQQLAAANAALATSNDELQRLLARNAELLASDETVLEVNQEILASLPLALLGVDDQNMIVYANVRALELFPGRECGIGVFAEQCLPGELLDVLEQMPKECRQWHSGGNTYTVLCHRMGSSSSSRGKVLLLLPEDIVVSTREKPHGSLRLG